MAKSSTTSSNNTKPQQQDKDNRNNVVTLVATKLAERKRDDLNYLRHYLLHPEEAMPRHRDSSSNSSSRASTAKERKDTATSSSSSSSTDNMTKSNHRFASSSRTLRCLLLDLPVLLLFASWAAVYSMRTLWENYYLPLINRARRTDAQLLEEYTYYERYCTAKDITDMTTTTVPQSNPTTATVNPTKAALETLLEHGAVTLPHLLSPASVTALQSYLQHKNANIHKEEVYVVSQGYQRLSYGLEATENPAVQQALEDITSHPLLPSLLEATLGVSDPALTELTAITAYFGAEDQVIHSDTKSDGYAAQFAQTYTHTYSLFVPVQDTTADMGVTLVCPGTHYCTNDDMAVHCRESMVGVDEVFAPSNNNNNDTVVWKAGDGFLFNQQVWHGGSAHTDSVHTERIMFVVSFAARPQLGTDPRQLARGYVCFVVCLLFARCFSCKIF